MFDMLENIWRYLIYEKATLFIGSIVVLYFVAYYIILKIRVKRLAFFFKKKAFSFQEGATGEIKNLLSVFLDTPLSKTLVEKDIPQLPVLGMNKSYIERIKFPYLAKRESQKHKIFVFDFNYNLGNESFVNGIGVLIQNPSLTGLPRVALVRKNMDFGRTGTPVAKIVPAFKAFKALFEKESETDAWAFFNFLSQLPPPPSVLEGVDFAPNYVLFYIDRRYFGGMREMKKFIELSENMLAGTSLFLNKRSS